MRQITQERIASHALMGWMFVIFFVGRVHGEDLPKLGHKDVVAHGIAYGILGALAVWRFVVADQMRLQRACICAALMAAVVGACDEFSQRWVPGRDPSLTDLGADVVGTLAGASLTALALRARAAPAGS